MEKWADFLVSELRYLNENKHIEQLKVHEDIGDTVGDASIWSKNKVIEKIDDGKTFYTIILGFDGRWKRGFDINVVSVNGKKYLRTDKNETKKDNLGDLPEF